MDTDAHRYSGPEADLTYGVIGAAFEVLNTIGHGLSEKPYERGLVVELRLRQHRIDQQRSYPVIYKGVILTDYIPDLVVDERVIVDTKVVDRITDNERGQMMNYLRITRLKVGLILNFKHARLETERVVL